ncbi:hypothetical protein EJF18_60394 [Clavispora lusitaniae]|uniref:Uncharacterized protein n=1 Tax=Clavispora lusitaniae TaxID=36911 RepID=A0ACD0WR50_CLALS|nr:hypothetical protein EJF14_60394 [Clavispora lusitaniae]QFZ35530.1 hypothetical protein EJF16_60394 [Clavispora lusitaniae]QFZ41224.1 hypothetical protein EJF15_60394 [Clavispora lusitaniae]QFZ46905.1 hypothetical protein EJF18_60394 [Clavispora lusitaniae]QFZ52570.1 hypothetical protein EJF17_60394 [Clavispora lusitaniae]
MTSQPHLHHGTCHSFKQTENAGSKCVHVDRQRLQGWENHPFGFGQCPQNFGLGATFRRNAQRHVRRRRSDYVCAVFTGDCCGVE